MKPALCAASVLLLASLVHGAVLSPEITLPIRYVPAPAVASRVSVASNGSEFFVVWTDDRSPKVRATRVSLGGVSLDPLGIVLAEAGERPAVVWGGTSWVVVWTSLTLQGDHVKAIRLDREGRVVAGPVMLFEGRIDDRNSVAVNGSRIAVNTYTRTILFDESLGWALSAGTGGLLVPHRNGFAVFREGPAGSVTSVTIGPDGSVGASVVYPSPLSLTAAATNGTDFLLLGYSGGKRMAQTIAGDLSGAIRTTAFADAATPVSAFWAGDHYVVLRMTWNGPVLLSRIEKDGSLTSDTDTGHTLYLCCASTVPVAAATNGVNMLLVSGGMTLNAQLFSTASHSPAGDAFPLTMSAAPQTLPAVASTASETFVAWRQNGSAYGARITSQGTSMDGSGVPLFRRDNAPEVDNENPATRIQAPRVMSDGKQFVLPYVTTDGSVRARFVSPEEGLLPELTIVRGFDEPAAWSTPAAAAGRGGTLIAWPSFSQQQIRGAIVDRATRRLLMPPVTLSPPLAPGRRVDTPALAWNGSQYLVVWRELRAGPTPRFDTPLAVRAVRLSGDLLPIDTAALTIIDDGYSYSIAVATNGPDWLVAANPRIRRVLAAGTMSEIALLYGQPTVAWSGSRYVLAWNDESGTPKFAYVPVTGPVTWTEENLAETGAPDAGVALAPAGGNRVVAAYARILGGLEYGDVPRVFIRFIAEPPSKRRAITP